MGYVFYPYRGFYPYIGLLKRSGYKWEIPIFFLIVYIKGN